MTDNSTEMTRYQNEQVDAITAAVMDVGDTGTAMIARAVEQMAGAAKLASALAGTSFVPAHFRGKPDDVAAAIMYGAAIGMDPMASLRAIYVVSGTPGMYARQMVALVQAAGHQIWTEESADEAVTVAGQRRGSGHVERVTWTIQRADKAGYTSNKKYATDPQAMLWARAAADVARRVAPDALAGLDTSVEELHVSEPVQTGEAKPRRESAATLLEQAPAVQEQPVEKTEEMITAAQKREIGVLFTHLDVTAMNERAAVVSEVVGRQVSKLSELTFVEAQGVIASLQANLDQPADDDGES